VLSKYLRFLEKPRPFLKNCALLQRAWRFLGKTCKEKIFPLLNKLWLLSKKWSAFLKTVALIGKSSWKS
jgi:hypothetical protein